MDKLPPAPPSGQAPPVPEDMAKLEEWQQKVIWHLVKYTQSAEVNWIMTIKKGNGELPMPESRKFLINRYMDGLCGVFVLLFSKVMPVDLITEEVAIKAIREKFASYRSAMIQAQLATPPGPGRPH